MDKTKAPAVRPDQNGNSQVPVPVPVDDDELDKMMARSPSVSEMATGLTAIPNGSSAVLDQINQWATEREIEGIPRFKRRYLIQDLARGKTPTAVRDRFDDTFRLVAQNEKEILVHPNPSDGRFFMHYSKEHNVVHFIIRNPDDGTTSAAIVPRVWLKGFAKAFKHIEAKEGHRAILGEPKDFALSIKDRIRWRLKGLVDLPLAFFPPTKAHVKLALNDIVRPPKSIERGNKVARKDLERITQIQMGIVPELEEAKRPQIATTR